MTGGDWHEAVADVGSAIQRLGSLIDQGGDDGNVFPRQTAAMHWQKAAEAVRQLAALEHGLPDRPAA